MIENVSITASNVNTQNNNLLNRPKPVTDPLTVQNLPGEQLSPERVNPAISNAEANFNANKNNFMFNPDSIINQLAQAIEATPAMADNMKKLLLDKNFINKNIKNLPELKKYFDEFIDSINMDKNKMLDFIKFQQKNSTKFNGEFFDYLRNLLSESGNKDLKSLTANFLKSYDCFMSQRETTDAIKTILTNITEALPDILKETFQSISDKLITDNPEASADINLDLLKNHIIPYLSKYITKTNDFGLIRDYISVLIHNVVRLESGSREVFSDDIENLFNYLKLNYKLSDEEIQNLKQLIVTQYKTEMSKSEDTINNIFELIEKGISEESNISVKTAFQNVEQSLLVNSNVQIPLVHIFLPVNFEGVFMFSEFWFSKVTEEEHKKNGRHEKIENIDVYNMFLTFDIEDVGYFETVAIYKENTLQIEIFTPSVLSARSEEISTAISDIITKNGLKPKKIFISECKQKRKFNEVFKNQTIKNRGINVFA